MLKKYFQFILPDTNTDYNPFPSKLLPFLLIFKVTLAAYLTTFEPHSPVPYFTGPEGHEFSPKIIIILDLILGGLLFKLTRVLTNSERAAYRAIHLWHISPIIIFPAYLGYAPSLFPLALTVTAIAAALYGLYLFAAIFLGLSCIYSTTTIIFLLPILLILAKDVRLSMYRKLFMILLVCFGLWSTLYAAARPLLLTPQQFQELTDLVLGTISSAIQIKIAVIVGLAVIFFSQGPQQRERPAIALAALCSMLLVDINQPNPAELVWTVPFWLVLIAEFHSAKTVFSAFYLCSLIYLALFLGTSMSIIPTSALTLGAPIVWGGIGAVVAAWVRGDR